MSDANQHTPSQTSPRELVERAQLLYGQWKREAALLLMIDAAIVTASRRFPSAATPESALAAFLDSAVYDISLGLHEPGHRLEALVIAGDQESRQHLGLWLLFFAAARRSDAARRSLPAATDFHADAEPWVKVTATEVVLPDMLIEGLATAVALAPENEADFPPVLDGD